LLLRPIERWDIDKLVERFFPYRKNFKKDGEMELHLNKLTSAYDHIVDFKKEYVSIAQCPDKSSLDKAFLADELFHKIRKSEDMFGLFKRGPKRND